MGHFVLPHWCLFGCSMISFHGSRAKLTGSKRIAYRLLVIYRLLVPIVTCLALKCTIAIRAKGRLHVRAIGENDNIYMLRDISVL